MLSGHCWSAYVRTSDIILKRQGAVSHSSTEAEIISLEEAVRSEGLSVLTFWEHVVLLFAEHRRTRQSAKKKHWYVELNSQPAQTGK